MPASLTGSGWAYQCRIVDIRTLPTEQLLASPHLEDNVLAVLTRLADSRATIRQILERISTATPEQRTAAIDELLLLAGLRQLRVTMKKELERMSVLIDINRHTIFVLLKLLLYELSLSAGQAAVLPRLTKLLALHQRVLALKCQVVARNKAYRQPAISQAPELALELREMLERVRQCSFHGRVR